MALLGYNTLRINTAVFGFGAGLAGLAGALAAPIRGVEPFMGAEALSIANDSQFGLTAGIMTRSLSRASHFRANMRAGCVMVNLPTAGTDYHVPFGGRGASSFGSREQGRYAAEFYTSVKTAYVAAGAPE